VRQRIGPAGMLSTVVDVGELLQIGQVEGQQAIDLVSLVDDDGAEPLSMYVTRALNGSWHLRQDHVLYGVDATPLWRVERDDCCSHYLGGGYCSAPLNRVRYGKSAGDCRTNLERGMRELGGTAAEVTPDACFNGFMAVDYAPDGTWRIRESPAAAGDVLALRAGRRQRVVISNCPQEAGATNGYRATSIDVSVS
jgi:uncharacterized protein YcgI (DUF1989 family)